MIHTVITKNFSHLCMKHFFNICRFGNKTQWFLWHGVVSFSFASTFTYVIKLSSVLGIRWRLGRSVCFTVCVRTHACVCGHSCACVFTESACLSAQFSYFNILEFYMFQFICIEILSENLAPMNGARISCLPWKCTFYRSELCFQW